MATNTLEAGCAMNGCLKPATRIGPIGVTDPSTEQNGLLVTCDAHADHDSIELATVRLTIVYRSAKSVEEPCQHLDVDKGDEFSPDRCRRCHAPVWPSGPRP